MAIRFIQKSDRGRQGRHRIMVIMKQLQSTIIQAEYLRKMREGKVAEQNKENQENEATVQLQQRMRGILARKNVEKMRQDEMEFLGMSRKKKQPGELINDSIKKAEQTMKDRK